MKLIIKNSANVSANQSVAICLDSTVGIHMLQEQ